MYLYALCACAEPSPADQLTLTPLLQHVHASTSPQNPISILLLLLDSPGCNQVPCTCSTSYIDLAFLGATSADVHVKLQLLLANSSVHSKRLEGSSMHNTRLAGHPTDLRCSKECTLPVLTLCADVFSQKRLHNLTSVPAKIQSPPFLRPAEGSSYSRLYISCQTLLVLSSLYAMALLLDLLQTASLMQLRLYLLGKAFVQ